MVKVHQILQRYTDDVSAILFLAKKKRIKEKGEGEGIKCGSCTFVSFLLNLILLGLGITNCKLQSFECSCHI
jgi:hypothetical protein